MKRCEQCGKEFEPFREWQKYCCDSCKRKAKYHRVDKKRRQANGYELKSITYTCKQCGKEYHPKVSKDRDIFCSRECHQKFMKLNSKPFEPKFTYMKYCKNCGSYFETKNKSKFKCKDCTYEENKNKSIEKLKRELREKYQKEVKKIKCEYCGEFFTPSFGQGWTRKKYCDDCKTEYQKIYKNNRNKKYKFNGEVDKTINLKKLIKRDKNICHICGEHCDSSHFIESNGAFIALSNYPSIDHVYPVSKGGTHTWDNVKLAHCICNSFKSNKLPDSAEN